MTGGSAGGGDEGGGDEGGGVDLILQISLMLRVKEKKETSAEPVRSLSGSLMVQG